MIVRRCLPIVRASHATRALLSSTTSTFSTSTPAFITQASTLTSTTSTLTSSTSTTSSSISSSPTSSISWADYFATRRHRNTMRPILGIPTALLSFSTIVTQVPFNPFSPILGIDPPFVVFFGALSFATIGYQIGGALSQLAWRLRHPSKARAMDAMDVAFYGRIKMYRAVKPSQALIDAASNKKATPPSKQDYYGEKIQSVRDYRHWLRRQRHWNIAMFGRHFMPIRGVPRQS